jgi:hydroxymethylbilane synthase
VRPDLGFAELRGNIETRLAKAADFDASVLAAVALERLDLAGLIAERIEPTVMLPQVGQGAMAVECRADDDVTLALVAAIDDPRAHRAVDAERAFLAEIGGGCSLPVGALARVDHDVTVEVLLASLDGRVVLRAVATDSDPVTAGRTAASALLDERGGRLLLEDLT